MGTLKSFSLKKNRFSPQMKFRRKPIFLKKNFNLKLEFFPQKINCFLNPAFVPLWRNFHSPIFLVRKFLKNFRQP